MPILHLNNVSHQFDNGDLIFNHISCTISERRIGLVGRNGIGKSVFSDLITSRIKPTQGSITTNARISVYKQQSISSADKTQTIAQILKVDEVLAALTRVEQGSVEVSDFELIADQWQLKQLLTEQLSALNLPKVLDFPCCQLSGGQLALLYLWQVFSQESELLILDEPSNHLDARGKKWLRDKITHYHGYILLISHDRDLLNDMHQIWELSELGLKSFGGNYNFYAHQKTLEEDAVVRQLNTLKKQLDKFEKQTQINREKAERRAASGVKLGRAGSQAKVLLGAMKDSATAAISNRVKNEKSRLKHLQISAQQQSEKQETLKKQNFYLTAEKPTGKKLVQFERALLPFGSEKVINLRISSESKLHLTGNNGSGKSTLLKVLQGKHKLKGGKVSISGQCYYLDQHFTLLNDELAVIDNVKTLCSQLSETEARILLAGIGFRKTNAYRNVKSLSGGEKMKLAMLIVSHQPTQGLLLLDEPDNHLDIASKDLLANTLKDYSGAFILVSHDQTFVDQIGIHVEYNL